MFHFDISNVNDFILLTNCKLGYCNFLLEKFSVMKQDETIEILKMKKQIIILQLKKIEKMKNIRWIFGLALILSLHCPMNVFAKGAMEYVWLTYCVPPGAVKKTKDPIRVPSQIPIEVGISQEEGCMYISSMSDMHVEYYICDSNNILLLHDSCDSSSLTWAIIDVNSLSRGIYYLYLNVNGAVYRGEIQIK